MRKRLIKRWKRKVGIELPLFVNPLQIEPCWNCGKKDVGRHHLLEETWIFCINCGTKGPTVINTCLHNAIVAWNSRSIEEKYIMVKRGQVFKLDSKLGIGNYFLVLEPKISEGYCGAIMSMDIDFKDLFTYGTIHYPDKHCVLIKTMSESEIRVVLFRLSNMCGK